MSKIYSREPSREYDEGWTRTFRDAQKKRTLQKREARHQKRAQRQTADEYFRSSTAISEGKP